MEFTHDLSQKFDISLTESAFFWKRLRYDASWWKEGFLNYKNIIFTKRDLIWYLTMIYTKKKPS